MEVRYDLLKPALQALSSPNPQNWVIEEKLLVKEYYEAIKKNAGNRQKIVAHQQIAGQKGANKYVK